MIAIPKKIDWASRLKAGSIHLSFSALVGIVAAALVFWLWYPWPYRLLSGGQSLFILVVSVDLVLGPLLTFAVFDQAKRRSVLARDLAVIVMLQLAGLAYGLHIVYEARPVVLAFETSRFRVVSDADVLHAELPKALPEFRSLSLSGPKLVGTRHLENGDDKVDSVQMALNGYDSGARPSFWVPYSASIKDVLTEAKPIEILYMRYPGSDQVVHALVEKTGRTDRELKFLPVVSKDLDWSVLIDAKTGEIVTFIPYDAYF